MRIFLSLLFGLHICLISAQSDEAVLQSFYTTALEKQQSYKWLGELCAIGGRLAGSENAAEAVKWGYETMKEMGFDTVYLQETEVPHWVRGVEYAHWNNLPLAVTSLGGSVSTPQGGMLAEVVEVADFDELDSLGKIGQIEGKIVFYNYPMKQHYIKTFHAYGDAVKYRWRGAQMASEYGAIASLVRSLTNRLDDFPHTGSMSYQDAEIKIPSGAISTIGAERLSEYLKINPRGKLFLQLESKHHGRVVSHNVIAEKYGARYPEKIMVLGGHLDSWDLADGAHDDGAGCVHAMGAAKLLLDREEPLKRTLRVVLFMNEEFGLDGAKTYADFSEDEMHVLAIESDAGGYIPRGFSFDTDAETLEKIRTFQPLFLPYGLFEFTNQGSGADVGQIRGKNIVLGGLRPESQRYFDVHHAATDVYGAVNARELEMGTASLAAIVFLLDTHDVIR
ncbi:MAG: M28 family peptidase [Cryomorphaceae bacterium]|nr:M28 family peptidase [Cryomorphaceae bacterium]